MRRAGEVGWVLFLAGLPFSHFLFYAWLDRWQAQTTWAHLWVIALFASTLCLSSRPTIPNVSLASWSAWISVTFLWTWVGFLKNDQYPLMLLMPWMHLIVLLAAYHAAMQLWTRMSVQELLCWMARAGLAGVLYGYCQWVGLDQFYRQSDAWMIGDAVVGNVGNQMHFSVYLALLLPVFLWRNLWRWHLVTLGALGLIVCSDSATGTFCAGAALAWWTWRQWPRWTALPLCGVAVMCGWWVMTHLAYLNPHGRLEVWSDLWTRYLVGEGKRQITGVGLGHIMAASTMHPPGGPAVWRHAHSEWLQAFIEQGLIGVSLLGWLVASTVRRVWRLRQDELAVCLGGIFLVFLLSSLIGFPAHLWILGSLGLTAYCGLVVLQRDPVLS